MRSGGRSRSLRRPDQAPRSPGACQSDEGAGMTWRSLMSAAAVIEAALLLVTGIALGDAETLAFGLVVAVTTGWFIWRSGRVPVLIRSLVFLDVLFFMATATLANVTTHEALGAVALPLALAITSATALVAH